MRALIQRVEQAQVEVDGTVAGSCGAGYLVLLGVAPGDDEALVERLWRKVAALRICEDDAGKTNLSLVDTGGSVLVVSQFTLYADARRGNRPSFTGAAAPELAERLILPRHALHACELSFPLGDRVQCVRSPLPPDLAALLDGEVPAGDAVLA